MPEAVIKRGMEIMPTVGFYHAYGQTETAPLLTILKPEFHSFEEGGKAKSAGRATYGVEICIKDEDGNVLPPTRQVKSVRVARTSCRATGTSRS